MDKSFRSFNGSPNGIRLGSQSVPFLQNQNFLPQPGLENASFGHSREFDHLQPSLMPANTPSSSIVNRQEHYPEPEDCDFSDGVLNYISQILMEEDMEGKPCMLQDSLDLQPAEKSFYEALGEKYPPSPARDPSLINQNDEVAHNNISGNYGNYLGNHGDLNCILTHNSLLQNHSEFPTQNCRANSVSLSSHGSSTGVISCAEVPVDPPNGILQVPILNSESQPIWQFQKGVEEASKFLPGGNELFASLDVTNLVPQDPKVATDGSKGRRHPHREEGDAEEERSGKQAAIYTEPVLRTNMFDIMLLHSEGDGLDHFNARREALQKKTSKTVLPSGQSKASNSRKGRSKNQNGKKEVVDLRTLLVLCAQAVAADDSKSAHELLKQIRRHSNPFGDGNQRLAYVFANGLEARLAGTGSKIYEDLTRKRTSAADILKAYHLYLTACPFRLMSNIVSNITIRTSAASSMRIHIIDFGILYGFQWPSQIQRFLDRDNGPPKIRITGIDFPQPGFRPAERVEETGRRLAAYAKVFKVPFEYNAIAKRWDTIQLEELKIDRDEFLVVNCLYRGKHLLDESVVVDSPRNNFLKLIRKINPDIFIHGVINGAFNAPFFVTRFREALFHYSALFDMLETIVSREDWERMVIEKEIFGREAMNVIACEGYERVERPESYKQWQARILRVGFVQQPFCRNLVRKAEGLVKSWYHKDFVIDEDGGWLLQGWKGRIIYALSCWRPAGTTINSRSKCRQGFANKCDCGLLTASGCKISRHLQNSS